MKDKLIANAKLSLESLTKTSTIPKANREHALEKLSNIDFPKSKSEIWRYSSLYSFDLSKFTPIINHDTKDNNLANLEKLQENLNNFAIKANTYNKLYIYNGFYQKQPSSIDSIYKIKKIDNLIPPINNEFFTTLNSTLISDGINLTIPKNSNINSPIYINNIIDSQNHNLFNIQNIINIEEFAKVTIIEHINNTSSESNWLNSVAKINIAAGANVDYYLIQTSNCDSINTLNTTISLGKDSKLNVTYFSVGNSLNHTDLNIELTQPGCEVNTFIVNNAKGKQNHNLNLTTKHMVPNCTSKTLYRAVLNDKSSSSFTGDIIVDKGATQTNADLQCKSLVMSTTATANARPQLIINCDDVKCSHGASIGHLDEAALFYLRTRGLPLEDAKQMLVGAFIEPVLEKIKLDSIRDFYRELCSKQFT